MKSYITSTKNLNIGEYNKSLLNLNSTKYFREVPFLPSSISKLKLWFDSNSGIDSNIGDPVLDWTDRIQGYLAYQSNASLRPTLRVNSTGGFKYLAFDRDWFQIDSVSDSRVVHMAVISSPNAVWDNYGTIFNSNNVRGSMIFFQTGQTYLHNNQYPQYCFRNGENLNSPFDLDPITNWFLIEGSPNSIRTSSENCYIAKGDGSFLCDVYIAELFIFDEDLTGEERMLMQNYINNKYGIISNNIPLD